MAEKDTEGLDEKSLELPSLFGRKKKRAGKAAPPADVPAESPAAAPAPTPASGGMADDATAVTEPIGEAADETVVTEPVRDTAPDPAPARPAASTAEPVAPAEPAARTARPQPDRETDAPTDEPTRTIPAVEAPEEAPVQRAEPNPKAARRTASSPAGGARKAKPAARSLPTLGASLASLVVGAVVGLLGVGLTWGSLQACDAVTGTDSCGGPGLLVVLLVVVVMIMAGSALLRAFGVPEPGGLSFLGVAIFVAICLVFLLENLLEPWMVVVGPVLCALGYGTANWVVNRFNTELLTEDTPEPHDVR